MEIVVEAQNIWMPEMEKFTYKIKKNIDKNVN